MMPGESAITAADVLAAVQALSSDLSGVSDKVEDLNDIVDGLSNAVGGIGADSVDYSAAIQQIAELLALMDVLLIVLIVAVFLACGLVAGGQLAGWMRADGR